MIKIISFVWCIILLAGCNPQELDKILKDLEAMEARKHTNQTSSPPATPAPQPEQGGGSDDQGEGVRNADVALVSAEWSTPQWAEGVNTPGWEDGPYISSDGNELCFAYINVNLLKLPQQEVIGPLRDTQSICNPPCGQFPRADLFYATKNAQGQWQQVLPHPITRAYPIGGIVYANPDKAYFMLEKHGDGLQTELYYAERINGAWQSPQHLSALGSSSKDDDPYVTPNDDELFFWSNRPAPLGGDNIYYAKKVNGQWSEPVILPESVNSNANDLQPFLFGSEELYFTSNREGTPKIYKSVLRDGQWSNPEVVIASKHAVGEPTLTADGRYLYFVQVFVSDQGVPNPDIMFTERK